jgi:hypothetical protein
MPNDQLAANAASMPTRRAALGSIAAASAMLAAPAVAALAAHPDAELIALQAPIDAAYCGFKVAADLAAVAEGKNFAARPEKPVYPGMDLPGREACAEFAKRIVEIETNGPRVGGVFFYARCARLPRRQERAFCLFEQVGTSSP